MVNVDGAGRMRFALSTRVRPLNAIGVFYMVCIAAVHRCHVAPNLPSLALAWAMEHRSAAAGGSGSGSAARA